MPLFQGHLDPKPQSKGGGQYDSRPPWRAIAVPVSNLLSKESIRRLAMCLTDDVLHRFLTISDRFIGAGGELERLVALTNPPREVELRADHLMKGMSSFEIRVGNFSTLCLFG
jgi:hypothetical protein